MRQPSGVRQIFIYVNTSTFQAEYKSINGGGPPLRLFSQFGIPWIVRYQQHGARKIPCSHSGEAEAIGIYLCAKFYNGMTFTIDKFIEKWHYLHIRAPLTNIINHTLLSSKTVLIKVLFDFSIFLLYHRYDCTMLFHNVIDVLKWTIIFMSGGNPLQFF